MATTTAWTGSNSRTPETTRASGSWPGIPQTGTATSSRTKKRSAGLLIDASSVEEDYVAQTVSAEENSGGLHTKFLDTLLIFPRSRLGQPLTLRDRLGARPDPCQSLADRHRMDGRPPACNGSTPEGSGSRADAIGSMPKSRGSP